MGRDSMGQVGNKLLAILLCSAVLLATTITPVSASFLDASWQELDSRR